MRKDNYVSLWLGKIESSKELDKYLKIGYTRDGDMILSNFAKDFKTNRYDDDFREAKFFKESKNIISEILQNFSYTDVITPYFSELVGEIQNEYYSAVILLYNYDYEEQIKEVKNEQTYFKFIGSTKYRDVGTKSSEIQKPKDSIY